MIKLTIDNSYSRIEGLKTSEFRALRKLLSYESDPQSAYFSGGFSRTKYLIDSKGCFPTGLLSKVQLFCTGTNYVTADTRTRPRKLISQGYWPGRTPYLCQTEAMLQAIECSRGTISMPTGSGKSMVIALITHRLGLKTLVVVPNLGIKQQLQETLKDLRNVTVENIDSRALKSKTESYDVLIIDEAHHVAAKTYQDLNKTSWRGIYYRFFLTATPFRNNSTETLLFEAIAGDLIYQLSYKNAVSSGYIVPVEAFYYQLPKVPLSDAYTWAQVYSKLVVNHFNRNQLIAYLLLKLQSEGKSVLCLVKEIKHGDILADLTSIAFINGQDGSDRSVLDDFSSGRVKALIATEGIMAEGIDSRACEYVIVAGLGKAKSAFMQKCGRAVRRYDTKDSGKVILFLDKSHKFTSRHYTAQKAILKEEYNATPIKLEI